jgi:L-aspartate oxidase
MYTSNPDVATGDGFAACWRAGLNLVNMEFVQFHPTVFYDPSASNEFGRRFLFTEALRGAGAFLKLAKDSKEDFVLNYDELGSKSTRDVVTRAEDQEMRKNGLDCVWLDCTRIPKEVLKNEFRNSYEFCLSKGIDMTRESIPVVYAEHYSNGGVECGHHSETTIAGLYVIGETSYTGLHGATRLASNSGPECILFGRLAAQHFVGTYEPQTMDCKIPEWDNGKAIQVKDKVAIGYYWEIVRRTMTQLCGISRNTERLVAAHDVMEALTENIRKFYWNYHITKEFLEVRNIARVASIIIESALHRQESRASHFMEDFPEEDDNFLSLTVVKKQM